MTLVHALAVSRDLARARDGEVWRQLDDRIQGLLERVHVADPDQHSGTDPRIDRGVLDHEQDGAVMAALLALGEDPNEQRAAAALERLDALDGGTA